MSTDKVVPISTLSEEQRAVVTVLQYKLSTLGVAARFVEPISVGPIVSVYRFLPIGSSRVSQLEGLAEDFAITLGVEDVFVKRMPGESAVGIFVPNKERKWVHWRDLCTLPTAGWHIPLFLGIDFLGRVVHEELTLMPHLLIAGSTGSGKSTLLNSIIASLILNIPSTDLQLALSDIKGVEWVHFDESKHLFRRRATSISESLLLFDDLIAEMEQRLKLFSKGGHRNILEYNSATTSKKPYICLLIDELFDILNDRRRYEEGSRDTVGKGASSKLASLAAKARATGIHIIASTQRPSVKLVEGDIKANFPARITFRLPSEADSRTVLGTSGAEHLLSRGDMLCINPNKPGIQRIHAPLADLKDIKAALEYATRRV